MVDSGSLENCLGDEPTGARISPLAPFPVDLSVFGSAGNSLPYERGQCSSSCPPGVYKFGGSSPAGGEV